jgi:hypothetical protein
MAAKKPLGPTTVEAIVHPDKRSNIPTADNQDFVGAEVETVQQLRWPRDPSLDPQLVWKGKDADADELVADAPPIYIQEKIDPRVLIENLRDTARRGELEPELTLFDRFDGLNELELVEFYQHHANWSNRMILGDSLHVMGSLANSSVAELIVVRSILRRLPRLPHLEQLARHWGRTESGRSQDHADLELLFDKPYEDNNKVRVATG